MPSLTPACPRRTDRRRRCCVSHLTLQRLIWFYGGQFPGGTRRRVTIETGGASAADGEWAGNGLELAAAVGRDACTERRRDTSRAERLLDGQVLPDGAVYNVGESGAIPDCPVYYDNLDGYKCRFVDGMWWRQYLTDPPRRVSRTARHRRRNNRHLAIATNDGPSRPSSVRRW